MVVRLRFQRLGRPKHPFFRLVAVEKRKKRNGEIIEKLGHYNPKTKEVRFAAERIKFWLAQGAQPSETVGNLLKRNLKKSEKPASQRGEPDSVSKPGEKSG